MRMDTFVPGITEPPQASDSDLWFVFNAGRLLVISEGESARVPSRGELEELGVAAARCRHYLGRLGERDCFTAAAEAPPELAEHVEWQGLRRLFGRIDETVLTIAGRAVQIIEWDDTHRYCGRCGSATALKQGERARVCPDCGLAGYPRLSPAVMGLVRRGRELLLARSPHFPEGMYSALAGFVEPGETLEQTLEREVREEVGVEITNLRYFGSQPWPFPHSLMIAFVADYVSGEIVPQPGEIEAADWFGIDRLPRLPHPVSIARRLIDETVASIAQTIA
ncbi:NAD(+) diphosphatase [Aromatoleum anaerobium]|uniref:NAD-capped RNA hydrolase NudC n=1 Tax=Aromatoleum anaerobium TaxID=182180 RepID=A0ABX1PPN0_9RHOO|nr:NAD(+) diphosphatase [Aromatoleum anaerobium]MCK0506593.1 NAD(+) diphosphatase [Aromatoleum anaerobium]